MFAYVLKVASAMGCKKKNAGFPWSGPCLNQARVKESASACVEAAQIVLEA